MFDRNEILVSALMGNNDARRIRAMHLSYILQIREEGSTAMGVYLAWQEYRGVMRRLAAIEG